MATWQELKATLTSRLQNMGVNYRGTERDEFLEIIKAIADFVHNPDNVDKP